MKRVPTPKESEIRAEVAQIQANRLESFFRQSFERIRTKIDKHAESAGNKDCEGKRR